MLEHLFTSKTRIKLLELMLFNQDREFHLREISRIIKTSPRYVSIELEKLEKINLVDMHKKGNLNIYSINKECIILNELKQIFLKTEYVGELLRAELEGKVDYALIFGSFAKGEEKENSDIDLLIIGNIDEEKLLQIILKSEKKTSREVNYIHWDLKTFRDKGKTSHYLLRDIKNKKFIMLVGDEKEFRKSIK